MNEEKIIETTEETIVNEATEVTEEPVATPEEVEEPVKRGRKATKIKTEKTDEESEKAVAPKVKEMKDDPNALKVGDAVRITPYVGTFLDGTPFSISVRNALAYVNRITDKTVELRNASGKILGSLTKKCVTKVNLPKK